MAEQGSYPRNLPSDELICLPFLDTDTTKDMPAANAELASRGYPSWLVRVLRGIALPGLWYQVVAWEWGSLGVYDVLLGYSVIFALVSPFAAILSNLVLGTLLWGAVPLVAALLFFTVGWLGLVRRRQASKRDAA